MQNLNGKNLKFLSGTQASIQQMIANGNSQDTNVKKAEQGAFYLTEDTHRLYVGADTYTYTVREEGQNSSTGTYYYKQADGSFDIEQDTNIENQVEREKQYIASGRGTIPVPVNAGIEHVATLGQLPIYPANQNANADAGPEEGAATFYYVDDGNILCVYGEISPAEGTEGQSGYVPAKYGWIQINSDTYINNIRYNTTHIYNKVPQNEIFDENKTYYIKNAAGGYEQQVNLVGFSNGVDYYLQGEEVAVVSLIPNNYNELNKDVSINLIEGNNIALTSISSGDNTGVKIEATDTVGTLSVPATEQNGTTANIILTNNDGTNTSTSSVTIQPGTLIDSVVGAVTGDITINASSQQISNGTIVTDSNGNAVIHIPQVNGLQQSAGTEAEWYGASITLPKIKYGIRDTSFSNYSNNAFNLNVYSQNEIDQLLAEATSGALATGNAMSYKALITENVLKENGSWGTGHDAYKNLAYLLEQSPTGITYTEVNTGSESFNSTKVYYTRTGTGTENDPYVYTKVNISGFEENVQYFTKNISNVNIGDTYRIGGTVNIPLDASQTSKFSTDALYLITTIGTTDYLVPGDLLIFNSDYKWEIVPAGNEPAYSFNLSNTSPIDDSETLNTDESDPNKSVAIELKDSNNVTKGTFNLTRDDDEALTVGLGGQNNNIITIKHKEYSNNVSSVSGNSIGFNDTLTYVSAITKDKHGHIATITTGAQTINHNYVTGFSAAKPNSNINNLRWNLGQAYTGTNSTTPSIGLDFTTNSLDITTSVTANTGIGTVDINLKWGSF